MSLFSVSDDKKKLIQNAPMKSGLDIGLGRNSTLCQGLVELAVSRQQNSDSAQIVRELRMLRRCNKKGGIKECRQGKYEPRRTPGKYASSYNC